MASWTARRQPGVANIEPSKVYLQYVEICRCSFYWPLLFTDFPSLIGRWQHFSLPVTVVAIKLAFHQRSIFASMNFFVCEKVKFTWWNNWKKIKFILLFLKLFISWCFIMLNFCMLASVILGVGKLYDWGEIQVLAGLAPFSQTVGHLEILSGRRLFLFIFNILSNVFLSVISQCKFYFSWQKIVKLDIGKK